MAVEPCLACGYETAEGSPFFPGRTHVLRPDGTPIFLCGECTGLVQRGEPVGLSEQDLMRLRDALPATGLLATVSRH